MKGAETVRPRIFAFVAMLGAVAAVLGAGAAPQALAAPAEVKLQVNQNCVEPNWPCWTAETSGLYPRPTSKVTVVDGGEVEFVEHDASTAAGVNWLGGVAPTCTGVPTTATLNWEGSCKFEQPGVYQFESATMFEDSYENYKKYEVVVGGIPKAKTTPTSTTRQTEATLTGSIEPEGTPTEYHFDYGRGSVSEHSSAPVNLGASDFTSHSVSLPVSGLLPGAEYHFELIVSYGANKTVSGGSQAFTTPPAAEPTVGTLVASDVKETEATLNGTINPNDGEATEYSFAYGVTPSYGQTTTATSLPTDDGDHRVSATLTKLTPGTLYYFKLVASNKLGATAAEGTFTTSAPAPPKEQPHEPPHEQPPPYEQPSTTPPTATQSTSTTTPASAMTPTPSGPLFALGSASHAPQRGGVVAGVLDVSPAAAGGRLEIDLLAKGSSLGKGGKRSSTVRVGRLRRGQVSAGKLSFTVELDAAARRALERLRHFSLTVKITLTPTDGKATTITYGVQLRGR